ncbi:MAG: dimethylarginine dimethylaminohydrolase [Vicinamibacteria bacterium]|nr:dimethylarginine dimethylaminohydrolase [Vicinamibacteria bacterium]
MPPIFHFDHALVRAPGASIARGLRIVDRGSPTREGVQGELDAYVAALRAAGVAVEVLPALDDFPDSIFVEDPALVFPEGAIALRPGAPSRFGETPALSEALRRRFDTVLELSEGSAEGGDVLVTPGAVLIGLSARTNGAGAEALKLLLARLGLRGEIVSTPPEVLHLKTDCALLDEETVLATPRLASARAFQRCRVILTPRGEEAAANAIRVNDRVFVGDRFPRTADRLTAAGYDVRMLPCAQIALLDGGLSCLSLRWRDGRSSVASPRP